MLEAFTWIYGIGAAVHLVLAIHLWVTDPLGMRAQPLTAMIGRVVLFVALWPLVLTHHVWTRAKR